MRIVSVATQRVRWPIEARGAARTRTVRESLLVELRDADGISGLGEAAPLPEISVDSIADAEHAIAALAARLPVEVGDPLALISELTQSPAARFAIETALVSIAARRAGCSLAELLVREFGQHGPPLGHESPLLGHESPPLGQPASLRCAVVVDSLDEARAAVAAGASVLKLKVGSELELERIEAIATLGVRLRLDANRMWSREAAQANVAALAHLPIELIEEPCRDARALLPGRIALDESLVDDRTIDPRLAAVILKPTLLGGLRACMELAAAARTAGVPAIVTHALEGPIGTAACAELALALGGGHAVGLAPHAAIAGWAIDVPQLCGTSIRATGRVGLGIAAELTAVCDASPTLSIRAAGGCGVFTDKREIDFDDLTPLFATVVAAADDDADAEAEGATAAETEAATATATATAAAAAAAAATATATAAATETETEAATAAAAATATATVAGRVRAEPIDATAQLDRAGRGRVRGAKNTVVESLVAAPELATLVAIYAALDARRPIALHHHRLPDGELVRQRAQLAAVPPDTAAVLFTSGSTSAARGVAISRRALVAACDASTLGWRDDDRWLLALSLAHAGGLAVAVRCLAARRPIVMLEGDFDVARVRRLLVDRRVTLASLVPAQLAALLDDPAWRPPAHLRAVLLGGAAAPPVLLAAAAARGGPGLVTYGMTETFGQIATAPLARAGDPDAPLVPLAGVAIAGGTREHPAALRIRAPMLATAYLDGTPIAPEHVTSDLGYVDGAVHIAGRADDVIITGGENVHPLAVEAIVAATPGVRSACAFGIADPRWGQIVAVAVVVGREFALADALAQWRAALPSHARPRQLAILDALPLLPTGKPDRRATALLPTRPI